MAKFYIGQPVRFVRQDPSQAGLHIFENGDVIKLEFVPNPSVVGYEAIIVGIARSNRMTFYNLVSNSYPTGFAAETEIEPSLHNPDKVEEKEYAID